MNTSSGPWSALLAAAVLLSAGVFAQADDATTTANYAAVQKTLRPQVEAALAALRQRQYGQAKQSLTVAANSGVPDAQYLLGMICLNGLGQEPDPLQAAAWLEKAATQGQREAAFVLAAVLTRGERTDQRAARQWLERSAELGYERARSALADPRPLLAAARELPNDAALRRGLAQYAVASDDSTLLASLGNDSLALRDDFGCSLLCAAVTHRAAASSAWLLQHGADPRSADSFGVTPLMLAAAQETPALLALLLADRNTQPDAVDQERRTALFYAARANRPQSIALLQQAGASLTATDSRGYGVLDVAILADARDAVAALRVAGARQQAGVSTHGDPVRGIDSARPGSLYRDWPAVAMAVARDDVLQLHAQLAAPGALQLRTPQGDTLLHVAYHAGAMIALRALVEAGADIEALDRRKRSVLMLAAAANNGAVMQLLTAGSHASREALNGALLLAVAASAQESMRALLTTGASASATDTTGASALAMAARLGETEIVRLLVSHGADVNATDHAGRSALWLAARIGDAAAVDALLAAQGKIDAADRDRNTPLMVAITGGKAAVAVQLIAAGAQTDLVNLHGDTALMLAAASGQVQTVQTLLLRAHNINAQNQHGDTAVILASRNGHVAICRELLRNGASMKLRNGNRLNAADAARDRGFTELANELDRAG